MPDSQRNLSRREKRAVLAVGRTLAQQKETDTVLQAPACNDLLSFDRRADPTHLVQSYYNRQGRYVRVSFRLRTQQPARLDH